MINNVLSLAAVPFILAEGAEAYADYGMGRSRGTMPIQLAGNIRHGGLYETAFGGTLGELVDDIGGGSDMGSFLHELPGYRHISDGAVRSRFEALWGAPLGHEPGLRIPNMLDAAVEGTFKALYIHGEDILQSDPNTHHVVAGLAAMKCVVIHDLFPNETANYAHIFLPGSTFLEKDGTFTNAERRIQRVRKAMSPKNGYADWEITQLIPQALDLGWSYTHPSQIMDEIARLTPTFAGVTCALIDELGSVQWPCNAANPEGSPVMHVNASPMARAVSCSPNMCRPASAPDRAIRCCSPPVAFCPSIMSARKPGAPPIRCGMRRTGWRSIARRRAARHPRRRLAAD